jgi:N-acetylglutamate synthase-like GNAT family acetyltransferase
MTGRPVLRQTKDHQAMRRLATRAGLQEGSLDAIVVSFGFFEGDDLVGCASLKRQDDVFSVECLAVERSYRGQGLGTELVSAVAEEARRYGARKLWALARAPGFFEKIGFRGNQPREPGAPKTDGCSECPQYQNTCFPSIVALDLPA